MNQQNNQNRPKPNVNKSQQSVDQAIVSVDSPTDGTLVANKDEVTAALRQELLEAKTRLQVISSVINNPYHQVGYLVTLSPIKRALEVPFAELNV